MKAGRKLYICFLLLLQFGLVACNSDFEVSEPTFDVLAPTHVKVNQKVEFKFTGRADLLTFSAGEDTASVRVLKAYMDDQPKSFTYEYPSPGVYDARFTAVNAMGARREEKIILKQITVGQDSAYVNLPESLMPQVGDKYRVGVYVLNGANYPYTLDIVKENGKAILAPLDYSKMYSYPSGQEKYLSYSPYNSDAGAADALPVVLPSSQIQLSEGDLSHVKENMFMVSKPIVWNPGDASPEFVYTGIYSVLKVNLSLCEGETGLVNVKALTFDAQSALALDSGTVNLETSEISAAVPSSTATVQVKNPVELSADFPSEIYLVLLPGYHENMSLKVVASNSYIAEVQLSDIQLYANKISEANVEVSLNDFKEQTPFTVSTTATSVKVGQEVKFNFAGNASHIAFWPGVVGHDYSYSSVERPDATKIMFSFLSGFQSAAQDTPLTVKCSNDFSGIYNEAEIKNATWTDISSLFTLPTMADSSPGKGFNTAEGYEYYVESGEAELNQYFGQSKSLYVGFFYHIQAYSAQQQPKDKTIVYISGMEAVGVKGEDRTLMLEQNSSTLNLVLGASITASETACKWYDTPTLPTTNMLKFTCGSKPSVDKHAYAITLPIIRKDAYDNPIVLMEETELNTPEGTSYVFDEPGIYKVVFQVKVPTMVSFEEKIYEFEINVTN